MPSAAAHGFGNSDGQNQLAFCFLLFGLRIEPGGADEIELVVDPVQKQAHIAQHEPRKPRLSLCRGELLIDIALGPCDRPVVFRDQTNGAQLRGLVFQPQKRPRVPLGKAACPERCAHRRR